MLTKNEAYIKQAIDSMVIDCDEQGNNPYTYIKSEKDETTYRVDIDDSGKHAPVAKRCQCEGHSKWGRTCKHMRIVSAYYQRIAEVHERNEELHQDIQQHLNATNLALTYTSDPRHDEHTYGTCGHIVKAGHEYEECGACLDKLFG